MLLIDFTHVRVSVVTAVVPPTAAASAQPYGKPESLRLLFNVVNPDTFNDEKAVEPFIYPNILVVVLFK